MMIDDLGGDPSLSLRMTKKSAFLVVFLLTLFEDMLKYPHVCQQANINRRQAKDIAENRTFSSRTK